MRIAWWSAAVLLASALCWAGPGAFAMVVSDFTSFAYAVANKLIREIAELAPGGR